MTRKIQTAMLIDDEEIDQKLYTRVLNRSGLVENVVSFTYADEAFEFLKANDDLVVDVIFLDINMPRMSGFEFLETAIAEFGPDFAKMVVIMFTTSTSSPDRTRAKEFDVIKAYFNKPLTLEHLQEVAELLKDKD